MVLCPGIQKNGRPCTNILEQKNKFCKLCGWKIDPEIFTKEAISCPNIPLNCDEICGTWIERSQMYCDQCGWEVNHDFFLTDQETGSGDGVSINGLKNPLSKNRKPQKEHSHTGLHQYALKESLSTHTEGDDILTSPNSLKSVTSASHSPRENSGNASGRILYFNNLNSEKITIDKLFNLFSMYGRVEIIKLFFHKRGSGLIQMNSQAQAASALEHLDRLHIQDRVMHLEFSRAQRIGHQDHYEWTKDFRDGKLNRGGSMFNYSKSAYAPSPVIHMANLRDGIGEEDIMDVFSQFGNIVDLSVYRSGSRRGALLEYAAVEQAVSAIMEMHNFVLPDNTKLIVSFSRFQSMRTKDTENS